MKSTMFLILVWCFNFNLKAQETPVPIIDQMLSPIVFNREKVKVETPPVEEMAEWTLVTKVRPSFSSIKTSGKTILTNDKAGWNNDILFGICPETENHSPVGQWAIIHQDLTNKVRTIATTSVPIEPNTWYHVVASSDGTFLRLYVNGTLVAGPMRKRGASLNFNAMTSFIGGSPNGKGRYFNGDIEFVQIYNVALSKCDIALLAVASWEW